MKQLFFSKTLLSAIILLFAISCRKQDQFIESNSPRLSTIPKSSSSEQLGAVRFDSHIAQSWYDLMLKLIVETPGHTPPIAARSLGFAGVVLYESVLGGTSQHHSLAKQLNGLSYLPERKYGNSYNTPIAANAALGFIIKKLFQNASPANIQRIDDLERNNEILYSAHSSDEIVNRSREYGIALADAVFNWSTTDGGHQAYLNNFPSTYTAPIGVDKWAPTLPAYQNAMLPYWGNNRTMVADNNSGRIDLPGPPAFGTDNSSIFYQAAREVYQTGMNLTSEQRTIALYWNDGAGSFTPPGHSIAIAIQLARNLNLSLNQTAILLAKVGIALNDAAIVCWREKFRSNVLRPVTFINQYIDPSWRPLIQTPPFPSYTSGHSTFSAAAAGILSSELGNAVSFVDSSKLAYGFPTRSFSNINAYAQEAATSRLYGGIHYSFDNDNGFSCGINVAMNVEKLQW